MLQPGIEVILGLNKTARDKDDTWTEWYSQGQRDTWIESDQRNKDEIVTACYSQGTRVI